ncbi:response regulator [Paenibacillus azoreducens]|uniref:response regulator n=1 Tax=Paenibacillus azoreducens TaxID=116718 RepID=UPI0039F63674
MIKNILIIEDDISLSNGITFALKSSEFACVQVQDLHSAKQKMKSLGFQLIILDINLPDGNGLDFLHVRQRRPCRDQVCYGGAV